MARWGTLRYVARRLGEGAAGAQVKDLPGHFRARYLTPDYFDTCLAELWALPDSDRQARATGSLGDIPLILLRHGVPDLFSKLRAEQAEEAEKVWVELQEDLAQLSANGEVRVAAGAGRDIPLEKPDLVVEAIQDVVEAAQRGGKAVK